MARRVLRSDDLAWDAVQEALLSLWREHELPPNPRAWLARTVIHRSLHLARSQSRRRKHEERACLSRPECGPNDDPARRLDGQEFHDAIQAALSEVAPEHRVILAMRIAEQTEYATIAATLQIPVGTVRSRLNRARKALREALHRFLTERGRDAAPDRHAGSSVRAYDDFVN